MNKRALVTYGWVRSSVAMVRNLALNGLEVYVADKQDLFMGQVSIHARGWHKHPDFKKEPEKFIESLVEFIKKKDIGTYLPSHEETMVIAEYRDRFPASVKIPISDLATLMVLFNKKQTYELAERLGVPYPKTYSFSSAEEFQQQVDRMPEHGIIKLQVSHGSHGVAIYKGKAALLAQWAKMLAKCAGSGDLPVVQQFITAKIYAVSLLADRGVVKAQFVRRNIREKEPFGGAAVKCESIHLPQGVAHASRMLAEIKYTGVAMMEFLVDETDPSKCWLMEANPRYWGTSSHDIDCGVEFPYFQWCMANGVDFKCPDYPDGLKSRWIVGDVISWRKSHKVSADKWQNLKRYLDFNDSFFMDFKLDDPAPFFVEAYLYWKFRKLL